MFHDYIDIYMCVRILYDVHMCVLLTTLKCYACTYYHISFVVKLMICVGISFVVT